MAQSGLRMTEPGGPPAPGEVGAWIGNGAWGYWLRIESMIERKYPGVFAPEWLFGGKKHGWSRRYKKGKSFCMLIPERNRFALLIVFGAEERAKVEAIRQELSERTRRDYDAATTYHDGKWLLLTVDADEIAADVERLLTLKRKPRSIAK